LRNKKKNQAMKNKTIAILCLATVVSTLQAQNISPAAQLGSTSPAVEDWAKKVAAKIVASQEYPRSAQVRGAEGMVKVRMMVGANGSVSNMEVTQTTAFDVLNREATKTIERAAPFPAPPGGSPRTLVVPLVWKLNK
jgi:periplasmic protein TonB